MFARIAGQVAWLSFNPFSRFRFPLRTDSGYRTLSVRSGLLADAPGADARLRFLQPFYCQLYSVSAKVPKAKATHCHLSEPSLS